MYKILAKKNRDSNILKMRTIDMICSDFEEKEIEISCKYIDRD